MPFPYWILLRKMGDRLQPMGLTGWSTVFLALTLWGNWGEEETWCLNQHSSHFQGCGHSKAKEECVQELRLPAPSLACLLGPTGGLESSSWLFTEAWCLQTQRADPEGPLPAMRRVSWKLTLQGVPANLDFFKRLWGLFCFCGCVGRRCSRTSLSEDLFFS